MLREAGEVDAYHTTEDMLLCTRNEPKKKKRTDDSKHDNSQSSPYTDCNPNTVVWFGRSLHFYEFEAPMGH